MDGGFEEGADCFSLMVEVEGRSTVVVDELEGRSDVVDELEGRPAAAMVEGGWSGRPRGRMVGGRPELRTRGSASTPNDQRMYFNTPFFNA